MIYRTFLTCHLSFRQIKILKAVHSVYMLVVKFSYLIENFVICKFFVVFQTVASSSCRIIELTDGQLGIGTRRSSIVEWWTSFVVQTPLTTLYQRWCANSPECFAFQTVTLKVIAWLVSLGWLHWVGLGGWVHRLFGWVAIGNWLQSDVTWSGNLFTQFRLF